MDTTSTSQVVDGDTLESTKENQPPDMSAVINFDVTQLKHSETIEKNVSQPFLFLYLFWD